MSSEDSGPLVCGMSIGELLWFRIGSKGYERGAMKARAPRIALLLNGNDVTWEWRQERCHD